MQADEHHVAAREGFETRKARPAHTRGGEARKAAAFSAESTP
jgi:hypothetical protein